MFQKDYREKFIGTWTFDFRHSTQTNYLNNSTQRSFYVGRMDYGNGKNELLISGLPDAVTLNVNDDGKIVVTSPRFSGNSVIMTGEFEGDEIVKFSYGFWGMSHSDMTNVVGHKGNFYNIPPVSSATFSRPFLYGASLAGYVNACSLPTSVEFQFGPTPECDQHISLSGKIEGVEPQSVGIDIEGINPGSTYYFRLKAENSSGTDISEGMKFSTQQLTGSITDIDGNNYETVNINNKTWLAENLRTTRYNDGSLISSNAFSYYDSDILNLKDYGILYNFSVVNTGRLCPIGWHVPTDQEWTDLFVYTDLTGNGGGNLKEKGNAHWDEPNSGGTNITGFSALPGGIKWLDGSFKDIRSVGYYWSSTPEMAQIDPSGTLHPTGFSWARFLYYNNKGMRKITWNNDFHCSVRCVMN